MAEFKCKICGAVISVKDLTSTIYCNTCGCRQTLPGINSKKHLLIYDRANFHRCNNDFLRAIQLNKLILKEILSDPDIYWNILLNHYGVIYTENTTIHKYVPMINRVNQTSVFDDKYYKAAIATADSEQRKIYEDTAKTLDKLNRSAIKLAAKEKPYDIFICYRETANDSSRTQDSILANEIYSMLSKEGLNVFYSRISLEDKIGLSYEPYIFSAINSAKIMIVLGTSQENFKSAPVINDWSRYLEMMKAGQKKVLLPIYKSMNVSELPASFARIHSLDMSSISFSLDLIKIINKFIPAQNETIGKPSTSKPNKDLSALFAEHPIALPTPEKHIELPDSPQPFALPNPETTNNVESSNSATKVETLLKRAQLAVEDSEFENADKFCEQILSIDPENAYAYLIKLLAEYRVTRKHYLVNLPNTFETSGNYKKVIRFGDEGLVKELQGYLENLNKKIEYNFKKSFYTKGCGYMIGNEIANYETAIRFFKSAKGFEDAEDRIVICENKISEIKAAQERRKQYEAKIKELEQNPPKDFVPHNLPDVIPYIEQESPTKQENIVNIQSQSPAQSLNHRFIIMGIIIFFIIGACLYDFLEETPKYEKQYNHAKELLAISNAYEETIEILDNLGNYKNSMELKEKAEEKYNRYKTDLESITSAFALKDAKQIIKKALVKCPPGKFIMGSSSQSPGHLNDEIQHEVIISKDFYIGKYPITQQQYQKVMGSNPSEFEGINNPVENISWNKAKKFCNKLNEATKSTRPHGYHFDLPTEAQWEYACRAGSENSLNNNKEISSENEICRNLDAVGWYQNNANGKTHPVGQKQPNTWGLFDMHGNVLEWCKDTYKANYPEVSVTDPLNDDGKGSKRVARGGSWFRNPAGCRSSSRYVSNPDFEDNTFGFRLALVPNDE